MTSHQISVDLLEPGDHLLAIRPPAGIRWHEIDRVVVDVCANRQRLAVTLFGGLLEEYGYGTQAMITRPAA